MSSRFTEGDPDYCIPYGLWENITNRAIHGKPGQKHLAELESALLALPWKRLIAGTLCDGQNVCAVGAISAHRLVLEEGKTWGQAFDDIDFGDEGDIYETEEQGVRLGMTRALAWSIANMNDEEFLGILPGFRWSRMLLWVRQVLGKEFEPSKLDATGAALLHAEATQREIAVDDWEATQTLGKVMGFAVAMEYLERFPWKAEATNADGS